MNIKVNGEKITCTPEHPFYILNAEDTLIVVFEGQEYKENSGYWVAAKDLKAGHQVLFANGKKAIIGTVEVEELDTPEPTYNFEVEDYHTYYVGSEGILVHNTCPTVNIDGEERVLYRGGDKFTYDSSQVKLDANGNVLPKRGLSVNVDPYNANLLKHGPAHQLTSISDELTFIAKGSPGHFEIIPKVAMPESRYIELLGKITVTPFRP